VLTGLLYKKKGAGFINAAIHKRADILSCFLLHRHHQISLEQKSK